MTTPRTAHPVPAVTDALPDRHDTVPQSDCGIFAKLVSTPTTTPPVDYAHRDAYYVFGMVNRGTCRISIDFHEYTLTAGECLYTLPDQIHRIVAIGNDAEAALLFVDRAFVEEPQKITFDEYALQQTPFSPDGEQLAALRQLFDMIRHRIATTTTPASRYVLRQLTGAFTGIMAETVGRLLGASATPDRHLELALAFKRRLAESDPLERDAGRLAEALCISPSYLNEVIRSVTGMSVGRYIRNELIVRAKRLLIYTTLDIRTIAERLDLEDAAYFTRLFTKATGSSPTRYREQNRM